MATTPHNPQAYANGYISMMRNMFLTSAVGLSAMAFSHSFSKYDMLVKLTALCIFIYSIYYGYKATRSFTHYITYLKTIKLPDPYRFQVSEWEEWIVMTYVYMAIVFTFAALVTWRKIT